MSVSAAELPEMSSIATGDPGAMEQMRRRLDAGLRRIAFFIVPSAVAFLALGDVIAAALLQTGRFRREDAVYVWGILAGSAVGLLASTLGRLYSSTYYALRDTRTPLRYALIRVSLTTVLGYLCAIPLPRWLGLPPLWGAAGLTASAGVAGWVEMLLLRRTLNTRIGRTGLAASYVLTLWAVAILAAAAGLAIKTILPPLHPAIVAALVLGAYGLVFFGGALALRVPEASNAMRRGRRAASSPRD
jgi:putative peptidoglycan lipid II flippase